ncbi:hypothetical protein BACCAP_02348 [Pseudoflavonifractor capillosus ATCC 29799]|uniref:Uncharacterized protein n=1 Tax=Pseudoflavonifractor capillosus ATCC 29799 TaxID=411467 RepID=A6NVV5_9FIRM|nr:hypothetical protein BACCAP_02348 [Pseudoflavonifractor capillosus ATCC 29799]
MHYPSPNLPLNLSARFSRFFPVSGWRTEDRAHVLPCWPGGQAPPVLAGRCSRSFKNFAFRRVICPPLLQFFSLSSIIGSRKEPQPYCSFVSYAL